MGDLYSRDACAAATERNLIGERETLFPPITEGRIRYSDITSRQRFVQVSSTFPSCVRAQWSRLLEN
jgi:hypothetical protein